MVEERVLAGNLPFAHAFLAHQSADTGPREEDLVERCRGKGAPRFVLEVAHVLLTRRDVARIPRVIGVGRADDGRVAPRDHEEQTPIALREQDVGLLHSVPSHDVDALGKTEKWVGPPAERRDRPVEPRSGRDDGEASADLDVATGAGVADTRACHPIAVAKKVADRRVIQD